VRRTWQIPPGQVRIEGRHWQRTLEGILARVAEGLGVNEPIVADFYKLLIYDQGSFFAAHRDTEKADGMFATLVLVLPSCSTGGELVIRHAGREVKLDLHTEDPGEAAFAAFYADCVHEVLPVTGGCRLALIYNLSRGKRRGALLPPDYRAEQSRVENRLHNWRSGKPEKLVYPLEHAYTPAELAFSSLKGADAAVAGLLAAAVPRAGCELHLALLTIEESGIAGYTDDYGRYGGEEDFEAVEVTDDWASLSEWHSLDGSQFVPCELPVLKDEFSPPECLDDLEPDEEHFREATGNEGASFERTYRRAALVLWPRGRRLAVLCQAGLQITLPTLESIVQRCEHGNRTEDRQEASALAERMIARWRTDNWYPHERDTPSDAVRMLGLLARLDNAALVERFVKRVIAAGIYSEGDNDALFAALARLPVRRRTAMLATVLTRTATTRFAACCGLLARAVGEVPKLATAARHLLTAMPTEAAPQDSWQRAGAVRPQAVADLLTACIAIDRELARRAIAKMLAWPAAYGMDAVLLPAVRLVMPCSDPALAPLLAACRSHLEPRIAQPLAPPTDWRRSSSVSCSCASCRQLSAFLRDPAQRSWTLRAAEQVRAHVEHTIRRAQADLDTVTERRGRPYSLICSKNQASYERRAVQRARDLADIALLDG
jgi:2OG-Fe(II) oxygenase superfamily